MKIIDKNQQYDYHQVNIIDFEMDGINVYLTNQQITNCQNNFSVEPDDIHQKIYTAPKKNYFQDSFFGAV